MQRRHFITSTAAACAALATPALAQARPLRIIVPYAAGGAIDLSVRKIAEKASAPLGTSIIIENKPGGGGGIGMNAVAKAPADGLTIGVAAVATNAINPWLFKKLPYDPIKDFAPITQMTRIPNVLVMNTETAKRLNISSFAEFLAYAKDHSAKMSYASGGNGSAGHLAGEMFKRLAGLSVVHVPYNGGGPSQIALLSGLVDFTFDNLASSAANIRAGKLLPLAVTTPQRSALLPNLPTVAATYPGFEIDTWWGLVAPAATPRDVVAKLNTVIVAALQSPEIQAFYRDMMMESVSSTPEQFSEFISREHARYENVVRLSGASTD